MTTSNSRESEYPIDVLFLNRWSPRAFTNETMPERDLLTILEAGRWAPSSSNHQPWRFVYALRGSEDWERFLGLLIEFNRSWVKSAAALVFVLSRTHTGEPSSADQKPIYSHSFDTGAAWASVALQAHLSGYQAHGMTGVDFDRVPEALGVPDGFRVECAVAIGRIGDRNQLPQGLREREVPSPRRPLSDLAFKGNFAAK
ncbi:MULTISPECIES: nitroreductase family protein [Rhizobium]|uniref:Nitroreductase n=1 Tax=Rhizobium esperanzae TaxID=1967781 RepID=A0A7W6UKN1_9HYPH|nr:MULTISPECIES: nitroreductase family protein [Rhizobium]MBB4439963.1 nitroreductase [Rhizobium esperanzae]MDH6202470.1 nitroreductase [Rhizobium leguminosarum]OAV54455.1 nitroreductase [Rhizobium sp. WYCCWR10014]